MKGERRFIATIARRLDSLGAITRGQRDSQTALGSGDQALFRESDNLESIYAKAALRRFYIALWRGHIEGWSLDRFEDATGLKLVYEGNLKEELPPMPRFLNRLLALPIAEQNQLFAELEARIAENIEQAIEAGSFEVGVETVRADSLSIVGRETLYGHPGTGAATELVEIRRRDRLVPLTADAALDIGGREPGAVLLPAPSRMFDDGGVQERGRLVRPATRETMARPEFDASNWRRADEAQWRTLWEHEIAELPSHRESRFWLAAGLLLPIWDRLPFENMRVRRLTTDDGEALIGRVLDGEQVRAARAGFGLDGGPAMTGEEAFEPVMARGTALPLANGWRLARRRIMGADRLEIEGPADTDVAMLKRIGCTVEIVSYRARGACARPRPRTLAARRLTHARAIRIAGPSTTAPGGAVPGARGQPPGRGCRPHPKESPAMTAQTLPDDPNYCFVPAYDIEDEVQQIRIVVDGMTGYIPTALVALTIIDAERLCDRLNAKLGFSRVDRDHLAWIW